MTIKLKENECITDYQYLVRAETAGTAWKAGGEVVSASANGKEYKTFSEVVIFQWFQICPQIIREEKL